jgi:hypothetical protein
VSFARLRERPGFLLHAAFGIGLAAIEVITRSGEMIMA